VPSVNVTAASSAAPAQPGARAPLAGLDTFMAATMKDWKMPGTAVAVVKGGQVVLLEGYGLRDLEGKMPVTPRTIFPIASITKSFTVAALASLAAEGKLDWDKPVHEQTEMGPAGTIVSTAEDLSHYLRMYLADYVGDYENPGYGLVKIERTKVMFDTGWGGEISGLAIGLEPQVKDIVFARMADRSMRDRAFLESLAGTYEVGPNLASVTLRGDGVLVLAVPGQPVRELEPVSGTTFAVKGLSGYKMEFKKDASGRVTEAAFHQPGTTLLARRKQ